MALGTNLRHATETDTGRRVDALRILFVGEHDELTELSRAAITAKPYIRSIAIVGIADAVEVASRTSPDVAVIDTDNPLGEDNAFDWEYVASRIAATCADTRLIILMDAVDFETLARAGIVGASGVLSKASGIDGILRAIRSAATGGTYVEGRMARTVPRTIDSKIQFTAREREVLDLLGRGLDAQTIARELVVSIHTARWHIKNILSKLGARTQLEAVITAGKLGLLRRNDG